MKTINYQVTEIELYLSEVGDGDPDLQFTPQEEYVEYFIFLVDACFLKEWASSMI